jgi:hypothetical protein
VSASPPLDDAQAALRPAARSISADSNIDSGTGTQPPLKR